MKSQTSSHDAIIEGWQPEIVDLSSDYKTKDENKHFYVDIVPQDSAEDVSVIGAKLDVVFRGNKEVTEGFWFGPGVNVFAVTEIKNSANNIIYTEDGSAPITKVQVTY
jgi:hypothetical protein